jgi:hypothetical protein
VPVTTTKTLQERTPPVAWPIRVGGCRWAALQHGGCAALSAFQHAPCRARGFRRERRIYTELDVGRLFYGVSRTVTSPSTCGSGTISSVGQVPSNCGFVTKYLIQVSVPAEDLSPSLPLIVNPL